MPCEHWCISPPLGANAIWWSIPAGWLIGAAVSLLRVKSGKWMRKAVADR